VQVTFFFEKNIPSSLYLLYSLVLTADGCLNISRNVWATFHIRPPSSAVSMQYSSNILQLTTIFTPTETLLYIVAPAMAESVEEILLYIMEEQNSS